MSTATIDDSVRWCLLTLVIASFLSVMCNGQMLGVERLAFKWMQHQSWSKFEDLLVNKTENIGVIADVSGQLLGLIRDLKLSPYLKAVSAGVNVSQQCIEDSIFYIESLFFNRSNWALQSKGLSSYSMFNFLTNVNITFAMRHSHLYNKY